MRSAELRESDYGDDIKRARNRRLLSDNDAKHNSFKCGSCNNLKDKGKRVESSEDSKIPTFKCCSCNEGLKDIEGAYETFLERLLLEEDGKDENVVDIDPDYKIFLEHLREDEKSYLFQFKHLTIKYEEPEELVVGKKKKDCPANKISDEAPRCSSKRASDSTNLFPFLEEDYKSERPRDDSYAAFLRMIRLNGTKLTMESDCGIVTYGEDDETDSEEDTPYPKLPKRKLGSSPRTSGSHTDDDDRDSVQSLSCLDPPCEYEDKLRKILNMRYSEQELKEKYNEASTRKLLERHRDLRGRALSVPTGQRSLSYLDHHPDLQHMVDMALKKSNVVRGLSLLRCLFFYLENVSHEGGFIPWKRPSVLNLIRDLDNKL